MRNFLAEKILSGIAATLPQKDLGIILVVTLCGVCRKSHRSELRLNHFRICGLTLVEGKTHMIFELKHKRLSSLGRMGDLLCNGAFDSFPIPRDGFHTRGRSSHSPLHGH
jgi:hypothetical protein